jgi:hypothetical protein
MKVQFITALPFIVATLLGCGQSLDVGSNPGNPTAKCAPASRTPRVLNNFSEFPDFSPLAVVVVGDAAYVSGLSFPNRIFDENVENPGRLLKFPLSGASPVEVWRGRFLSGPLKSYENQIAFVETDPNNVRALKNFSGIHLYDTTTGRITDVPNLEGRNYVAEYELGIEGLVFSAGTSASGSDVNGPTNSSFSLARFKTNELAAARIVDLPREAPGLFRRSDHVLASITADNSVSGLAAPAGDYRFDYSVFRITASGLELEQRLGRAPAAPPLMRSVIGADESFYYLASSYTQADGWFVERITRQETSLTEAISVPILSGAFRTPRMFNAKIYWTPTSNRSMLRQAFVDTESPTKMTIDTEVVFDERSQITAFSLSPCQAVWLSTNTPNPVTSRLMVAPKPEVRIIRK